MLGRGGKLPVANFSALAAPELGGCRHSEGPRLPSCPGLLPARSGPVQAMTCADAAGSFCGELPFPRSILQMEITDRGGEVTGGCRPDHAEVPEAGKEKKGREPGHCGVPEFSRWETLLGNLGFQSTCSEHPVRLARALPQTQLRGTARS